ncbi:MAG: isoaspartyl peptidase/L-asparaginase [Rhodothermales bacterium]
MASQVVAGALHGPGPALLIHGGAWDIPDEECPDHLDGLEQAVGLGSRLLAEGATAVRTVREVVALLETHGAFDAGRGAVLTREGTVELDAGIMCGSTLRFGAVAGVRTVANPICAADRIREVGRGEFCLLAGGGAEAFAREQGLMLVEPAALVHPRERARYERLRDREGYHTSHPFHREPAPRGTVGCVALDAAGRLAAATSTGGTPFRPSGRIGDSPLPGCGFYADDGAAASATGWGEAIATVALCARAVDAVGRGAMPVDAARERMDDLFGRVQNADGHGATGGLLLMSRTGAAAWAFTTPRMARAGWRQGGAPWWRIDR